MFFCPALPALCLETPERVRGLDQPWLNSSPLSSQHSYWKQHGTWRCPQPSAKTWNLRAALLLSHIHSQSRGQQAGLVWEAWTDFKQKWARRCWQASGASRGCSSLCLWPWAQLQVLLLPLTLLPLLVILLLQLPLNLLWHLHLQQVLQALLWLVPNKYLPAGEAREELAGIPWTHTPPPTLHPPG